MNWDIRIVSMIFVASFISIAFLLLDINWTEGIFYVVSETNSTAINKNSYVIIKKGSESPDNINFFVPSSITIEKGTMVTWKNEDYTPHTVTSGIADDIEAGKDFDSDYLTGGKTFQWTFSTPGTFDYFCTLHPYMEGKVIVASGKIASNSTTSTIPNNESEETKTNTT